MSRPVLCSALILCASWSVAGRLAAQTATKPFAEGIRAYQSLDFEQAAALLRRDFAAGAVVPPGERARGLVYLGAADLFRGRRDSALAVFRRLVRLDPRYRPDRLLFPPEVTGVFDSVRAETRAAVVVAPRDTAFAAGVGALALWIVGSAFQNVDVTLRYEDGAPFRALYAGPMGDSLRLQWDGLDAAAQLPSVRRVLLRVASRAPTGELAGILQLPIDLRIVRSDTVAWPPSPADSLLLPERSSSRPAVRALAGSLLLSGAVAALPLVVGGNPPSGPRLAVAGTVGLAGMLGYLLHRPGQPVLANIRANRALRDQWQQGVAAVKLANERRRNDVHLAVRTGEPSAIQPSAR
ncbi:MAG TPA: hypothetical protein VF976_09610 [Gemmatimonadales bacterium]